MSVNIYEYSASNIESNGVTHTYLTPKIWPFPHRRLQSRSNTGAMDNHVDIIQDDIDRIDRRTFGQNLLR